VYAVRAGRENVLRSTATPGTLRLPDIDREHELRDHPTAANRQLPDPGTGSRCHRPDRVAVQIRPTDYCFSDR
jgi:hypothetical protein